MKAARLLLASVIFVIFFLVFKSPVFAQGASLAPQTQTQVNPYSQPINNPDVPKNLHTWTQNALIEITSAITCQIAGFDPTNPQAKCLGVDPKTNKIGYIENGGGAVGVLNKMMADTYNIPVHAGDFTNYLAQNFGFEKKTYAANGCIGIGFCGLTPLLPMWTVFRNIVYLVFVLVFMIIGIAIMLRVHIDPRTVMTIENQIPKLIIGLILVTFSYAIAGFLVDFMYIAIFLVFSVMSSIPTVAGAGTGLVALDPQTMQNSSAIGIVNNLAGNNPLGVFGFIHTISMNIAGLLSNILQINQDPIQSINPFDALGSVIGTFQPGTSKGILDWMINTFSVATSMMVAGSVAQSAHAGIGPFSGDAAIPVFIGVFTGLNAAIQLSLRNILPYGIVFFVLLIAVIWALFRVWFMLIQAYIFTLIDIATAPFWFLFGLVPGSKLGFSLWFRDIVSNLAVFPVVMTMFWIGKIFIDAFGCDPKKVNCAAQAASQFTPPLIGASINGNMLGSIVGIAVILSTPEVLKQARAFFKAPELNFKSVAQAIGVGTAAPAEGARFVAAYRDKGIDPKKLGKEPAGFAGVLRRIVR